MDYLNHHKMTFINHSITLTVCFNEIKASKVLSEREILILLGYNGVVYNRESSLFCLACTTLSTMSEEVMLEFLDYTDEDWENMWDYVESKYYNRPPNLVDCRKN